VSEAAAQRVIGTVDHRNGYAGMIEAMRNRAADRRIAITSADVAATAGLASHYIAKLLSPSKNPVRRVGMISFGTVARGFASKASIGARSRSGKTFRRPHPATSRILRA
jgi:hypothetical protein